MYLICIESFKMRGMGHLFRTILYADYLKEQGIPFLILVNDDQNSVEILLQHKLPYIIVDYESETDWETELIQKYDADVWLEDKFETSDKMAERIAKNTGVLFCMIDEFSRNAVYADIHFGGMLYLAGNQIEGKKTYYGSDYVILNPEIDKYKHYREGVTKIIVTLGGSDPFGVTVDVVRELNRTEFDVEIVTGPDFDYKEELNRVNVKNYPVKHHLPSMIEEFSKFDFAITGGGVTCCEANASGLPCLIIANAPHEEHTGKYMESKGGSIYAGAHDNWDRGMIARINGFDIGKMSRAGLEAFDTHAVQRIFTIIRQELNNER